MAERHTAAVVASYLSNVEDDEESECSYSQDNGLSDNSEDNGERSSNHVDHAATEEENSSTVMPLSSDDISLVAKKNTKSQVWRHFGLKQVDGKVVETDKPVCRECSMQVCAKFGNTSNLYSHLKTNHPDLYTVLAKSSQSKGLSKPNSDQPTIKEALLMGKKLAANSKEHKRLTTNVTYWLAKDCQPEYSVEKPGFKHMLKAFSPRYDLPSCNYFSRTALPKLFNETYKDTISSNEVNIFSATTDLWTSCAKDPFLSYTIHYLTPEWQLRSYCLCTRYIVEDHTGENLKESLLEILDEWSFDPGKQVAITTDNGSNIKLACRLLG